MPFLSVFLDRPLEFRIMRIVVVDDVQDYLNSLVRVLSGEHTVLMASSIEQAQQTIDNTIQLALLDIRLSELDIANRDGILLLSWIKENYPQIPVIMMSAYRDFDAAADALNLGASYYLKKPISLRELRELISFLDKNKE